MMKFTKKFTTDTKTPYWISEDGVWKIRKFSDHYRAFKKTSENVAVYQFSGSTLSAVQTEISNNSHRYT